MLEMKQRWVVKPPPPLNEHEAAYIEHGRMKAWVDRKISHLVLACWKRGWETETSCENIFSGAAHIAFRRITHLREFMSAVAGAQVDWEALERVMKERIALDAGWMVSQGYRRQGHLAWASEDQNGVIFPLEYASTFLACIAEKRS